ncbi:MAG: hypothetical protein I8H73_32365 [Pseudomonadales bacterium]|nr:hypothetical protein [Pseudomonadales bacterium]
MKAKNHSSALTDQVVGTIIGELNNQNELSRLTQHVLQDQRLEDAFSHMANVRAFLLDPETILGSGKSKHGEIAEHIEVGLRNARAVIDGLEPPASFRDPVTGIEVGRISPIDFFLGEQAIQVKFYNGLWGNLNACLTHMSDYPDLAKTAGYLLPSDRYEQIIRVINGDTGDLNPKTINAILEMVKEIEAATGRPFAEAVQSSVSTYPSVQLGAVNETLDNIESDLVDRNEDLKDAIDLEHAPSLVGMAQAGLVAGAIAGSISIGTSIYAKAKKDGKNPFKGEFSASDWAEVGFSGAKGFGAGAVSGSAIYALTNFAEMSAPMAGAMVSITKGMAALTVDYSAGNISAEEFVDMGMFICSEAAMVGIATAVGQTLIPVPILGGVIGSISGKMMMQAASNLSAADASRVLAEYAKFKTDLDAVEMLAIEQITAEFDRLGDLTTAAFDLELNRELVLSTSVLLAEAHGVFSGNILRTTNDVDDYMLG